MDIARTMLHFIVQTIPEAHDNVYICELSTYINEKSIERTFSVFAKIDNDWVIIFMFFATEYFDGYVHLELVDSLQFYKEINRTNLYHTVLLAYFYTCSCRGLSMIYFQSCPPGENSSYIFHDKPAAQKQLSSERLVAWYHKLLMKGFERGIFSEGSNFVGSILEEIPDCLVDPEYRNESLDKSTFFRVTLSKPSVIQQTKLHNFDTAFCSSDEFKATCIHNNISFSTLDGAKSATRIIINSLGLNL